MVYVFDANSSRDEAQGIEPKQFRFVNVIGARLDKSDWQFSGRSSTSRRTITASVKRSGFEKMEAKLDLSGLRIAQSARVSHQFPGQR